jgi:5-methylcytosine-specific restriction endonuclease McrA
MSVFVLDKKHQPLMPCSEKRARKLLESGRARVHRLKPFTIRLVDRMQKDSALQSVRIKIDPGSQTTGIAVVRDIEQVDSRTGAITRGAAVLGLIELQHRGAVIHERLTARAAFRRRRRGAHLRYRAPRFNNRVRSARWLAPSLQHRVNSTMTWVRRLQRWTPVAAISSELVRFDLQKHENPEISGIEYQQGTLAGYEVKEYLLDKFARKCIYCDKTDRVLNLEHLIPRARGGSDRISNLAIACIPCNGKKAARTLEEFVKDPARLARIKAQLKAPLKDAAAVNATRWALANVLKATGLPVELSSGGRTKFNRAQLGVPKTHSLDAACVGHLDALSGWDVPHAAVKAMGRGVHCRTKLDAYGFPRGLCMCTKRVQGFQAGDTVRAAVPKGKHAGVHIGRVAVRASGSFNVGALQGISAKHCKVVQRADGYEYAQTALLPALGKGRVFRAGRNR